MQLCLCVQCNYACLSQKALWWVFFAFSPVAVHRPWLRFGGGDLQLLYEMRGGRLLLLGPYICRVSKLHQALVLGLFLNVFAANAAAVC